MHIFLQGRRGVGKSTVIRSALDILSGSVPLSFGGFFTWNSGKDDPRVYMRPAFQGAEFKRGYISVCSAEGEMYLLASWDTEKGGMSCNTQGFERDGTRLLENSRDSGLIIMDELGFLESDAARFKQAVMDTLAGDVPVLGVLRLGGVPWHEEIKRNPRVTLVDVTEENRDTLPGELAERLLAAFRGLPESLLY